MSLFASVSLIKGTQATLLLNVSVSIGASYALNSHL